MKDIYLNIAVKNLPRSARLSVSRLAIMAECNIDATGSVLIVSSSSKCKLRFFSYLFKKWRSTMRSLEECYGKEFDGCLKK